MSEPREPVVPEAPDVTSAGRIPEPDVRHRQRLSPIWIVPLVVALVGGWLVWKTLSEQGPQITISFKTAEGIEAGKTRIRYKNIEIGLVEGLRFAEDFRSVLLTAQMARDTAPFLRRGTRFWVVKPQLGVRGVSGLSTLVSGAFIEIEPGQGAAQRHFEGLESAPVIRAEEAGRRVALLADDLGSLDAGSPVYYRGILAGEVLGHELGNDRKSVLVYAFVHAPFDRLVRGNTRFWNVSGVDVSVSSEGITVRTESIQTVLFGGIAFETPDAAEPPNTNLDEVVFTLHPDQKSIADDAFTQRVRFVLYFDGSVRGLNVGAPVEFKGIKVGQVVDVRLEFDPKDLSFRIPVVVEIEPERVIARGGGQADTPYQVLSSLVDRGLRARLQTGSLITGQLFVELDMHPDTPLRLANAGAPYPELPTIPASLDEITTSVKNFLATLDKLDLEAIAVELLGTLKSTNTLFGSGELQQAVADAQAAVRAFREILVKVDRRVEPLAQHVDEALVTGRDTLARLQVTLTLMDEVLRSDSPLQYRVIEMVDELTETARSIRSFVDLMERNPQSVIFGKPAPGDE